MLAAVPLKTRERILSYAAQTRTLLEHITLYMAPRRDLVLRELEEGSNREQMEALPRSRRRRQSATGTWGIEEA